ncbi:hypothetical protein SAY87_004878 [Trapa incisa]|uniref:DUF4408 domain-containing protein n=1 Tax=Trapa incisa TaxID=236973 RepID=A0AAN7PN37_9MYRT|nr:hypothetical protein SAY87_004878 [Trapa incisa]
MESTTVDTVKAGKAKAARGRHRVGQFKSIIHALEAVFAVLIFLSWFSGGSFSLAVDQSLRLFHVLNRPLTVFFLSNCIIVAIFLLSTSGDGNQKTTAAAGFPDRIYDDLTLRRNSPAPMENLTENTSVNNLKIVPYVNEGKAEFTPATDAIPPEVSSGKKTILPSFKEREKNDRRTRSGLIVRPSRHEDGRALQRSMTDDSRGMVTGSPSPRPVVPVDVLSNEEFNRRVDNYIARTRWIQKRELMADLREELLLKSGHDGGVNMALTVRK